MGRDGHLAEHDHVLRLAERERVIDDRNGPHAQDDLLKDRLRGLRGSNGGGARVAEREAGDILLANVRDVIRRLRSPCAYGCASIPRARSAASISENATMIIGCEG